MKSTLFARIAGTALLCLSSAHAQDQGQPPASGSGVYVGLGVSATPYDFHQYQQDGYKATPKLFAGYEFNQTWGMEAGISRYTGTSMASAYQDGVNAYYYSLSNSGKSLYVAAKASVPVNERFAVYGKLGVAHNEFDNVSISLYNGYKDRFHYVDSRNGLYASVGALYKLTDKVGVSVEYEHSGTAPVQGVKTDALSLSARYSF